MDEGGPRCWYAVAAGIHTGIYFTFIKADKLVKGMPSNKHRKFKRCIDAERWLQREYLYNGNAQQNTPIGDNSFQWAPICLAML